MDSSSRSPSLKRMDVPSASAHSKWLTVCDNNIMERAIHRIMVAKAMERIADQATNIAETAIFVVKGVSAKHHCMPY